MKSQLAEAIKNERENKTNVHEYGQSSSLIKREERETRTISFEVLKKVILTSDKTVKHLKLISRKSLLVFEVSERKEILGYKPLAEDVEKFVEGVSPPSLDLLSYEEGVSVIYKWLEKYSKTPKELAYDLLNEMARELYAMVPGVSEEEVRNFRLDFEKRGMLAQQLRWLRREFGISLDRLSQVTGHSAVSLSMLESMSSGYPVTLKVFNNLFFYLEGLKKEVGQKAPDQLRPIRKPLPSKSKKALTPGVKVDYETLNEIARELYAMLPGVDQEEASNFSLNFEDRKALGLQLRALRKGFGISLQQLSNVLGYNSYCYLKQIEKPSPSFYRANPKPQTLYRYLLGLKEAVLDKDL